MKTLTMISMRSRKTQGCRRKQDGSRPLNSPVSRFLMIVLCLLILIGAQLLADSLVEIGNEYEPGLNLLKGEWRVCETGQIFSFTDTFARRLYGLKYFYYYTSVNPKSKIFLFTIVKSNKTGRLYFARGEYKYRSGDFYSSTSRIRFRGKNRLVVYSKDNYRQVLFEADRIIRENAEVKSR